MSDYTNIRGRVTIYLDDNQLEKHAIKYEYKRNEIDSSFREIKVERLHQILYEGNLTNTKGLVHSIALKFARFMFSLPPINHLPYINRYPESKVKYNDLGYPILPLPISINTEVILHGIHTMVILHSELGSYTPLFLEYRNQLEEIVFGRVGMTNERAIYLLYSFLVNNRIKIYGMEVVNLSFETFFDVYRHIEDTIYHNEILGSEPQRDTLLQKIIERK